MVLNCSSRSLLVTDDCAGGMLGCGFRSEEASPLSSRGVNSRRWDDLELLALELELEDEVEYDPVDLLPTDPFGMNLETTFTAAIASCIGDLTAMSGAGHFGSGGDEDLFALSYYFNQAFVFAPGPWNGGYPGVSEGSFGYGGLSGAGGADRFSWLPLDASCTEPIGVTEGPSSSYDAALACCDVVDPTPIQEGNDAPDGMVYVLGYLGLRDVLSVEMVCKSLRSAVRRDSLIWRCIHIDSQLGEKVSDADLLCMTQKCPGSLKCLSLEGCNNITDQGLKAVLDNNLQLTELGIFGALRITHQGIINSLRSFNVKAKFGIKKLRVADRVTASEAQYEELLSLLSIDKDQALHKQEPRIFHSESPSPDLHGGHVSDCFLPDLHDKYALDIEKCPRCPNYKLVYDCPSEECKIRSGTCRGCIICIRRCLHCGICIDTDTADNEFDETFLLYNECRNCHRDLLQRNRCSIQFYPLDGYISDISLPDVPIHAVPS